MPQTKPKQPLVLPDGRRRAMSVPEVADEAGVNKALVYRQIQEGSLKASRLGGVLRVTAAAFDEWMNGGDDRPGTNDTPGRAGAPVGT